MSLSFIDLRSRYVSAIQKKLILKYLKRNPELLSPKFSVSFKFKDAQMKWTEMANILNRVPGSRKDWRQWRKTWHDMRSKTKLKHQQGIGVFSKTEKDILRLIGEIQPLEPAIACNEIDIKTENEEEDSGNGLSLAQFLTANKDGHFDSIQDNTENVIFEILPSELDTAEDQKCENSPIVDEPNFRGNEEDYVDTAEPVSFQENYGRKTGKQKRLSYYERKLIILNKIARAKEKSAAAKERIADALERIAEAGSMFM